MSQRAELDRRHERLSEITDIMTAMKTMALMETRKLGRFIASQQQLLQQIERVAADFLDFHPPKKNGVSKGQIADNLLIIIGSERGFCGDFNETLTAAIPTQSGADTRIIAIGHRLSGKVKHPTANFLAIEGANIAEEVPSVLDRLLGEMQKISSGSGFVGNLGALTHDADGHISVKSLLPITTEAGYQRPEKYGYPPKLNLDPAVFFSALTQQYLSARLPALFYDSLMAENRHRLEHMETALNRMRNRMDEISRKRNAVRQEEITEQIEMILLGVTPK